MWLHSQDAHIQMGKQDTGSRAIKNVVMINWLVQEKKWAFAGGTQATLTDGSNLSACIDRRRGPR